MDLGGEMNATITSYISLLLLVILWSCDLS